MNHRDAARTSALRELEIRQEARFVLWALRCVIAAERGNSGAEQELVRGFEVADVAETLPEFREFALALCAVEWPMSVWHDPGCACLSAEELIVLQAIADAAGRLDSAAGQPVNWWRTLLPEQVVPMIDLGARRWLAALRRGGICFPGGNEIIECLRPLERMTEPAAALLH